MAIAVKITLTIAGADTGPFNLYSNIDGFLSPFETSVAKSTLQMGYTSFLVPDGTTTVRVQSDAVLCTNYIDFTIGTTTTTTSTSSTSTTTTSTTTVNPALYDFYVADQYVCGFCTLNVTNVKVRIATGSSMTLNRYYSGSDGYVYFVKSVTSSGSAVQLTSSVSYINCVDTPCA